MDGCAVVVAPPVGDTRTHGEWGVTRKPDFAPPPTPKPTWPMPGSAKYSSIEAYAEVGV